ncbi:sigma-70 family RNA polymerase sigma factor [Ferrimonas balearica]|uniref:sigma-70 family RNA polymerase sigma factor n=1 Tax=Ferrimonas balearica TaxID=44012 RepID=UPI00149482A4|nr:sigma-70 family RNA polymerase sigma factor [Ferrimonas balearica]MBY6017687.1 sigma-70 family RNA polymerase sigma factor [Halomonas denitrificans]MBW3139821.1 sigma-70 family RNA polymerase sigma factor [Ferrimonas balearica]MBW3164843.1 sigma-70 family RNA polymerase sigma factor [Ferrimonas balearica]MBY6094045.1 sigma-70 family RNA polymerase sigma factor [Ferrimonas balearica]MBY6107073.1 sigma-70 family RNA polymerase sigma factor [Ferrimonas balearica]
MTNTMDEADQHRLWLGAVAKDRDKNAFAQLFRHFAPRLLSHARRQLGNDALAQEMVQEAMTKVWLKAHLYHPDKGRVSTWVFTVARNVSYDMMRRAQARPEHPSAEDLYLEPAMDSEMEADQLDQPVLRQQLEQYCRHLPPKQLQVVTMIYFEDRSHQEVADALGVPLGTVKSRLRLALNRIRELLDEHH